MSKPDGSTVASIGTRWLQKSQHRAASITLPNGATMTEVVEGEDATMALKVAGNSQLLNKAALGGAAIMGKAVK